MPSRGVTFAVLHHLIVYWSGASYDLMDNIGGSSRGR